MNRALGLFLLGSISAIAGSNYSVSVLPSVNGWNIYPTAVNDSGQFTGYAYSATGVPIIGSLSGISLLPLEPGWNFGAGESINEAG